MRSNEYRISNNSSWYVRITTSTLVAEVSNAGGLGILGAARLSPSKLKESIQDIKKEN
ncbi:MAG TPA: nitronate monooxygenase [Candidatus Saccharimonadales bacterium]|nr:nitronate monooxygenase [Candidatus Saccharimonadales bacterium]